MRRAAFLMTLVLAMAACGGTPPSSSPAASGPPADRTELPAVGVLGRPEVTPITAVFNPQEFTTYYTASISTIGQEHTVSLRWSGPNCGDWQPKEELTGSATEGRTTMTWSHPHPPCAPTTNHADVLVTLTVSNSKGTTVCVYQGSESGTGPACKPL